MRRVIFILTLLALIFQAPRSYSANPGDYCYVPPFVGNAVKPNVLIVMDFSGSMQFPAYVPCNFRGYSQKIALCGESSSNYNSNTTYSGYFDPNKCYRHSGNSFQEANCDCSDKIGTSSCISGNLLNWISTTRIDIARKVLTGGRSSRSEANTFLDSEGAEYTIRDNNLKCEFKIDAKQTDNRELTISNYNGTCPLWDNNNKNQVRDARLRIRPSDPSSIKGIIHNFCDISNLNGQINEKCQIIMEFMVFGGNERRGKMKSGKRTTISDLISDINNEQPYGEATTGEALWEAYDYYKQSNDHNYEANNAYIGRGNANKDPYYDGSGQGQKSEPVPCRKGFVLLISGGAWNGNVDPVVPALTMATTDLRDDEVENDLKGPQNVITYVVYAFGDLQGKQAMITTAIFGGFEDKDGDRWPYPFTQYPNNSRDVSYPLSQCNPNGTWNPMCAEWDTVLGSQKDGLPYNFFEADDEESLRSSILKALYDILKRSSSGATVATLSSRYQSSAVIVQPAFYPELQDINNRKLKWIGILRGYWVDTFGKFREDTNADKVLQIFGEYIDKVFTFFFDSPNEPPKVAFFDGDPDDDASICTKGQTKDYDIKALSPTLEFDCRLAENNPSDNSGRDIRYLDNSGSIIDFTPSHGIPFIKDLWQDAWGISLTDDQYKSIVKYLRGMDQGYNYDYTYTSRNNLIDLGSICPSGYSGVKVWKLGPIVYSTPAIAGNEPLISKYMVNYNDDTYRTYVNSDQYKKRISMAFVGTNQGFLHFFRIGFLKDTGNSWAPAELVDDPTTSSKDRVGREEFALIPRNAIPYIIQYGNDGVCGDGAYIPIIDYRLDAFDASFYRNYSPTAQKNQNSWRTYLLVPMGLGGKAIYHNNNLLASSSVLLLDITNHLYTPSNLPQVMWEFRMPDQTLTTAYPARVRIGDRNQNGYWYFVMGSGPKDPHADNHSKFTKPELYIIDPSKDSSNLLINTIDLSSLVPNDVNAAVGDIAVADLDDDYQDDVIYFGMYGYRSNGTLWGGLFRIALKDTNGQYEKLNDITINNVKNDVKKVLDLEDFGTNGNTPPVFAAVSTTTDDQGNLWVYVNTGLFLSVNHKNINYSNYLIGFKDPCWDPVNKGFNLSCNTVVSKSQLVDSTQLSQYVDSTQLNQYDNCSINHMKFTQVKTKKQCVCSGNSCTQKDIVISTDALVDMCKLPSGKMGWYYKLPNGGMAYSKPVIAAGVVISAYFEPSDDPCNPGKTYTLALNYKTGLPLKDPVLVTADNVEGNTLKYGVFLAYGSPPLGEMFRFVRTPTGVRLVGQTSEGALINVEFRRSNRGRFVLWIEK